MFYENIGQSSSSETQTSPDFWKYWPVCIITVSQYSFSETVVIPGSQKYSPRSFLEIRTPDSQKFCPTCFVRITGLSQIVRDTGQWILKNIVRPDFSKNTNRPRFLEILVNLSFQRYWSTCLSRDTGQPNFLEIWPIQILRKTDLVSFSEILVNLVF